MTSLPRHRHISAHRKIDPNEIKRHCKRHVWRRAECGVVSQNETIQTNIALIISIDIPWLCLSSYSLQLYKCCTMRVENR